MRCGAKLGASGADCVFFFCCFSSPAVILEKQGRGREYGSLSDAGGEEPPPPDNLEVRVHAITPPVYRRRTRIPTTTFK